MAKIIKRGQFLFPNFVAELINQRDKGNFHEFTGNNLSFMYYRDRSWKAYPSSDITLTTTKPKLKTFRHIEDYSKGALSTEPSQSESGFNYLVNLREFFDFLQNSTLKADDFEIARVYSIAQALIRFNASSGFPPAVTPVYADLSHKYTMKVGDHLTADMFFYTLHLNTIKLSSSDESIAYVDKNTGEVVGRKAGKVVITGTVSASSSTVELTVEA